ncbi:hypothetical protein [Desulfosarcina sp. BuS5]|uniref:hypothetical protein n=1 Tax=Desulfosarcina sp. BuS5 TaxID=933262 RepID=UPI0018DE7730|nr:hypothetical protein [Desulfosarcina sp. BuS5]
MGKEFYITSIGKELVVGKSVYRYILVKPTDMYKEMFNLDREIVLTFSPYVPFEPRSLDAIPLAINRHQNLRIERICSVIVSKDDDVGYKLSELLKNDQEAQIVVPFAYQELIEKIDDSFFFRNRFKKHFFSRDLFASEAPLKKDLYFFGRHDLVHSFVTRHRSNQVSGLFGLRKTGKTSVLFGIQRALNKINGVSVFIDCQNPAFHRCRWNKALNYVLTEIKKQHKLSVRLQPEDNYSEAKAPIIFEDIILKMSKELGEKNILLIFDEIENITPGVSPSEHWTTELDFIFFWQTLRSLFQKLPKTFSYLIVGTNPLCVETESIHGKDNPIYGQIPLEYIPRFDVPQTREMVRRLGKIMGMKFDEILYGKLTEDFGGHPYLIRHVCSVINKISKNERPVRIDKSVYEKAKKTFIRDYSHFMEMILNVLHDHFNDEYEMLKYLSLDDIETFKEFADLSPLYTNHLIGYGIVEQNEGNYTFRIETIRDFLSSKQKYKKLNQTQSEMWAEISERRNVLEPRLRSLCRMQLQAHFGSSIAHRKVLDLLGKPRKTKNNSLSFSELFDGNKSKILFSDLPKMISKYWDCFKNILGPDKNEIIGNLNKINTMRKDAHANNVSKEEMQIFRAYVGNVEKKVDQFFG